MAGDIQNFTGVDAPYEAPANPELRVRAATTDAGVLAQDVIDELIKRGIV